MSRLTLFLILLSLGAAAVMAQQIHVVQRGENLYQISRRYDRTVEELAQANGISPPYFIHAGNKIRIPAPGSSAKAPAQEPETMTASEETHCYIIGDVCVIISNVCYLEVLDCGDGADLFSQRAWKQGWCMAAIYAGVVNGTVWQCIEGSARTIAEKALVSSLNGMLVIWQHQLFQYQQSNTGGNQQSNTGGNNQVSGANGGGDQQQLIVLHPLNQPQDQLPGIPPNQQEPQNQQDQQQLLQQILQEQAPQQLLSDPGSKGEQSGVQTSNTLPDCQLDPRYKTERYLQVPCNQPDPKDLRVDRSGTVSGDGNVMRPTYTPRVPASGSCRGSKHDCFNCSWQREQEFGGKQRTETRRVCKVKGQDPCTEYEDVTINISDTPAKTTWRYVCS